MSPLTVHSGSTSCYLYLQGFPTKFTLGRFGVLINDKCESLIFRSFRRHRRIARELQSKAGWDCSSCRRWGSGAQGLPAWEGSPSNTRCLLLHVSCHHVPGISLSLPEPGSQSARPCAYPSAPTAQHVLIPSKTSIYLPA